VDEVLNLHEQLNKIQGSELHIFLMSLVDQNDLAQLQHTLAVAQAAKQQ
jgi:hypothetical protein